MIHKEHTVIIENENIEDINFDEAVDIVGITVTVDVFPRAIEISKIYQSKGIPVVAGGIHITAFPEQAKTYFDIVAVGLAEKTWPDIIRDFQNEKLKKIYRCNGEIKGSEIVSPGYHLIDTKNIYIVILLVQVEDVHSDVISVTIAVKLIKHCILIGILKM